VWRARTAGDIHRRGRPPAPSRLPDAPERQPPCARRKGHRGDHHPASGGSSTKTNRTGLPPLSIVRPASCPGRQSRREAAPFAQCGNPHARHHLCKGHPHPRRRSVHETASRDETATRAGWLPCIFIPIDPAGRRNVLGPHLRCRLHCRRHDMARNDRCAAASATPVPTNRRAGGARHRPSPATHSERTAALFVLPPGKICLLRTPTIRAPRRTAASPEKAGTTGENRRIRPLGRNPVNEAGSPPPRRARPDPVLPISRRRSEPRAAARPGRPWEGRGCRGKRSRRNGCHKEEWPSHGRRGPLFSPPPGRLPRRSLRPVSP